MKAAAGVQLRLHGSHRGSSPSGDRLTGCQRSRRRGRMNSFAYSSCRASDQPTAFMFNDSGRLAASRRVERVWVQGSSFQLVKQPFSPVADRPTHSEKREGGASKLHEVEKPAGDAEKTKMVRGESSRRSALRGPVVL